MKSAAPSSPIGGAELSSPERIRKVIEVLRNRDYDASTGDARSKERYRRALLISLSSFVSRATSMAVGLVTIPMMFAYLGHEQYGLWIAISSLLTWASLMDFGVGRGLVNLLSDAGGTDDLRASGEYVSSAFSALLFIATVAGIGFSFLSPNVPWSQLLNVADHRLASETRSAVGAMASLLIIGLPLSIVNAVYASQQRAFIVSAFSMLGSLLSLLALVAAIRLNLGLVWLIFALGGTRTACTAANLIYMLVEMPALRPRARFVTKRALARLLSLSLPMFLFQIGALLVNEIQIITIARTTNLASVADYSLFLAVYMIPMAAIQIVEAPFMPAYREAYARSDLAWVKTAFWRMQKLKLAIAAVVSVGFILLGNAAVRFLSHHQVNFSLGVWVLASVLFVAVVWGTAFSNLLTSIDRMWLQVILVISNGIATVALTHWLSPRLGLPGVLLASVAFPALVASWLLPLACKGLFNHLEKGASR